MGKFLHGKPLGGGLYQIGGDIETDEKLISVDIKSTTTTDTSAYVLYHFETFDLKVSWKEETKGKRTDIHWERIARR